MPRSARVLASVCAQNLHKQKRAVLIVGGEGTAKTSTNLMFLKTLSAEVMFVKRINFSSATTPARCQNAIEVELDKRGGKSFGPPQVRALTHSLTHSCTHPFSLTPAHSRVLLWPTSSVNRQSATILPWA